MSYANLTVCGRRLGQALLRSISPAAMSRQPVKPSRDIARLIEIMAALRTPGSGCPWDLEQTFRPSRPIRSRKPTRSPTPSRAAILDDLQGRTGRPPAPGRVPCPHGRGTRRLRFRRRGRNRHRQADPPPSARLCRCRRPHRQGGRRACGSASRREEKAERGEAGPTGALAGVPVALPALTRALKLQDKAGRVGFDWNDPRAVLAKIREEADEIEAELDSADKSQGRGRGRRPAVRGGQPRPPSGRRPGRYSARRPTSNSSGVSRRSSARWPRAARRPRTPLWPRWTRCGTKRRPRKRA